MGDVMRKGELQQAKIALVEALSEIEEQAIESLGKLKDKYQIGLVRARIEQVRELMDKIIFEILNPNE